MLNNTNLQNKISGISDSFECKLILFVEKMRSESKSNQVKKSSQQILVKYNYSRSDVTLSDLSVFIQIFQLFELSSTSSNSNEFDDELYSFWKKTLLEYRNIVIEIVVRNFFPLVHEQIGYIKYAIDRYATKFNLNAAELHKLQINTQAFVDKIELLSGDIKYDCLYEYKNKSLPKIADILSEKEDETTSQLVNQLSNAADLLINPIDVSFDFILEQLENKFEFIEPTNSRISMEFNMNSIKIGGDNLGNVSNAKYTNQTIEEIVQTRNYDIKNSKLDDNLQKSILLLLKEAEDFSKKIDDRESISHLSQDLNVLTESALSEKLWL